MSARDLDVVQGMLARERLSVDAVHVGRTTFLSHLGSIQKLVPGAWIAHRDHLYALALANLSPEQRTSLARAVLIEHGREFGVGRLTLSSAASGLPLGGASLLLKPRVGGPSCLYTWALGAQADPAPCEWLLLRAQPGWALDAPPTQLTQKALETLDALELRVALLVATAAEARHIADTCLRASAIRYTAHPRFLPHLTDDSVSEEQRARVVASANLILWPHDAIKADSLVRREPSALVLVNAPEDVVRTAERWADDRPRAIEVRQASAPGRLDRRGLAAFWRACGRPRVLLRGDPAWAREGANWLYEQLGAKLSARSDAKQLGLF